MSPTASRQIFLLAMVAVVLQPLVRTQQPRVPEVDIQERVFENGFRLILVPRPMGGMVDARMFFGVGSALDPPGLSGLAHFFEHATYEGTARLGTTNWAEEQKILARLAEIEDQIEREKNLLAQSQPHKNVPQIGEDHVPLTRPLLKPSEMLDRLEREHQALLEQHKRFTKPLDINNSEYYWGDTVSYAGTGTDATAYESFMPAAHLEAFFWIQADKFEPVVRNFYQARDTVQEQVLRWSIEPEQQFTRALNSVFFSTSFGHDSGGGFELEQATPADIREFKRKYVMPNNSHMVIVGDFETAAAIRLAETYFGKLPRGEPPPRVRIMEDHPAGEKRFTMEGSGRPRVEIRFPLPPGGSAINEMIDLLAAALNGPAGRLAAVLGSDRVTSVTAMRRSTRNYGYFAIMAYPRNNDEIAPVEERLLQLLEELRTTALSPAELDAARRQLAIEHVRLLADARSLSYELGAQQTLSTWRDVLQRPGRWAQTTPDNLRNLASETFPQRARTVGISRHVARQEAR